VPVVEGGDQVQPGGEQHPVTEHVPGHVADPGDGHRLGVDVGPRFPQGPADRDPGTARGDPHGLVVVTRGAAGGERVAQPEPALHRQGVGQMGGDDEVRVVPVVHHGAAGVHDGAVGEIVGDVEQAGDDRPVGRGDPLLRRRPVQPAQVRADDEGARGPGGHDDRVLHQLRLEQAEHLGAEVLGPVGPADATARHGGAAQAQALHGG
jgi:hypothetical protein